MLRTVTALVNFVLLAASLWLGLYVVTRSPRAPIARLTGLTLWSMAGLFLNALLALYPPPVPANLNGWLWLLLPFWPAGALGGGSNMWLQGWLVISAVAFWHHVTLLIRPGSMTPWRWTRAVLGYAVTGSAVLVQMNTTWLLSLDTGDSLYLNALHAGPLFLVFFGLLGIFTVLSLLNLARSARAASGAIQRRQLWTLAAATLIAGLADPVSVSATVLGLRVPRVALSLLFGVAVLLIGWGVARYSALVEGRTLGRDLAYNAVAVGLVTALYMGVTWLSVAAFRVPPAAFIFMLMLIVVTHTLVEVALRALDRVFYRREVGRLRANLRRLAQLAGELDALDTTLVEALHPICASVDATFGLIFLFEKGQIRLAAADRWHGSSDLPLQPSDLAADDALALPQGRWPPPLTEAALLVPLYAEDRQLGTLLLGRPKNGTAYSESDLDLLLDSSDRLADGIRDVLREAEYLDQLARLANSDPKMPAPPAGELAVKVVEDALRNLFDFAYLGETSLAELKLARARLPAGAVTHLDRGKAVHNLLVELVERFRPTGSRPASPPQREWHQYLVLHDAYLEGQLNRDIMARLYISEGTFNRVRRSALRALGRALEELEVAVE